MHRFTALLLAIGIGLPLLSGVYFAGLAAGLPFGLAAFFAALCLLAAGFGVGRIVRQDRLPETDRRVETGIAVFLLAGAVACGIRARHYGDWDAALIWNLHARYLTTDHWRQLFAPGISGNSTYPYGLPGTIAFFWRLTGTFTPLVPFLLALLPTLSIPALVLLQSGKHSLKSILFAALAFLSYRYYFALGLAQYADIQIAFLLLLLLIVADRFRTTGQSG